MNTPEAYIVGPDRAPVLADGTFRLYREILTPDAKN